MTSRWWVVAWIPLWLTLHLHCTPIITLKLRVFIWNTFYYLLDIRITINFTNDDSSCWRWHCLFLTLNFACTNTTWPRKNVSQARLFAMISIFWLKPKDTCLGQVSQLQSKKAAEFSSGQRTQEHRADKLSSHDVSDNNTVAVTLSREKDDKAGKWIDCLLHRFLDYQYPVQK